MRYSLIVLMLVVAVTRAVAQPEVVDWSRPITLKNGVVEFFAWDGTIMRMSESSALDRGIAFAGDVALLPPDIRAQPVEAPYFVVRSETNQAAIGFTISDAGEIIPWVEHNSPWSASVSRSNKTEAVQTNLANRAAIVGELKGLKFDCTNAIAEAQAIDPSVFTGAQRTQIQNTRKALVDTTKALNQLRRTLLRFYKVEEDDVPVP